MSCYWIRLGGSLPATEIAPHTPPTWETLADGGTGEISFAFSLTRRSQHPMLRAGVKVEVLYGPTPVATGVMTEPDRTTWEVKAQGLAAQAPHVLAVDAFFAPTRDLSEAVGVARFNGWWQAEDPWGVSGVLTGDSEDPMTLDELFNGVAAQTGQRWGTDGQGRIFMRPDPSSPDYMISPDAAAFGVTDEDQATEFLVMHLVGGVKTPRLYRTFHPRVKHEIVDLTSRGEMTTGEVDTFMDGVVTLGKAQTRWTNGVELDREQITRNGVPAYLPTLTAGSMVRATGIPVDFTHGAPWLDVVVGKTRYTAGARTIYLEPVNTAPRVLADVIAAS